MADKVVVEEEEGGRRKSRDVSLKKVHCQQLSDIQGQLGNEWQ
jgi:hypothetical protein